MNDIERKEKIIKGLRKLQQQNRNKKRNARGLYKNLYVKSQCSNWMRWKIEKYNLIENEDYKFYSTKTKDRPRSQ
jgi:phage anti-repressor protein